MLYFFDWKKSSSKRATTTVCRAAFQIDWTILGAQLFRFGIVSVEGTGHFFLVSMLLICRILKNFCRDNCSCVKFGLLVFKPIYWFFRSGLERRNFKLFTSFLNLDICSKAKGKFRLIWYYLQLYKQKLLLFEQQLTQI